VERITKRQVSFAFNRLSEAMFRDVSRCELEVWSPGDGCTRYRLTVDGHNVGLNFLGASEAYHGFHFAAECVERANRDRQLREVA